MSLKCVAFFVMVASTLQFANAQGLGLQGLINIFGTTLCTTNGITPIPNALVEVVCSGNVISSAITNELGMFNTTLNPLQIPLSNLLSSNCNVHLATPLSNCNGILPSAGVLQSPLQFTNTTVRGFFFSPMSVGGTLALLMVYLPIN